MVASTKKGQRKVHGLFLSVVFVMLASLLTACGATGNQDFSVPLPAKVDTTPVVSCSKENPGTNAFCQSLLQPDKKELVYQQVSIYNAANAERADIVNFYDTEMRNRQWNNVSPSILQSDALGTKGSPLAFEKYTNGDVNKKNAVGVIILSPDATNNPDLAALRNSANLKGNILITIEAGNTPLPTPAPTK
ncbi:MAG TPA: hypothetical protein VH186_19075 [Chloroflexia bacterium]|nr:hypothetical protein [Chloroflexia bacterium]